VVGNERLRETLKISSAIGLPSQCSTLVDSSSFDTHRNYEREEEETNFRYAVRYSVHTQKLRRVVSGRMRSRRGQVLRPQVRLTPMSAPLLTRDTSATDARPVHLMLEMRKTERRNKSASIPVIPSGPVFAWQWHCSFRQGNHVAGDWRTDAVESYGLSRCWPTGVNRENVTLYLMP
jgi:hypothetical protein